VPHRHDRLDPARDGVDAARESEEVQRLALLADSVGRVYARAVVVALLQPGVTVTDGCAWWCQVRGCNVRTVFRSIGQVYALRDEGQTRGCHDTFFSRSLRSRLFEPSSLGDLVIWL